MILFLQIRTRGTYYTSIWGIYGHDEKFFIQAGAKVSKHGPKKCLDDMITFLEGVILRQHLI